MISSKVSFGPLKKKLIALASNDPTIKCKHGTYRYERPPVVSGSFGKVYKGVDKRNATIAVKEIPREKAEVEHLSDDMNKLELNHKNFAKMHDFLTKTRCVLHRDGILPSGRLERFLENETIWHGLDEKDSLASDEGSCLSA